MTWDELFEDRLADAGHLVCAIDEAGDHVTLVEAPVGEVVRVVREALLSDEAVERAARGMYENAETFGAPQTPWEEQTRAERNEWAAIARVALMAALEGEQ